MLYTITRTALESAWVPTVQNRSKECKSVLKASSSLADAVKLTCTNQKSKWCRCQMNYLSWISSENSRQKIFPSSFVTFIASSACIKEKYQIYGQISGFCIMTVAFWCTETSKNWHIHLTYLIWSHETFLCLENWKSYKAVIWNNLKAFGQRHETYEELF